MINNNLKLLSKIAQNTSICSNFKQFECLVSHSSILRTPDVQGRERISRTAAAGPAHRNYPTENSTGSDIFPSSSATFQLHTEAPGSQCFYSNHGYYPSQWGRNWPF